MKAFSIDLKGLQLQHEPHKTKPRRITLKQEFFNTPLGKKQERFKQIQFFGQAFVCFKHIGYSGEFLVYYQTSVTVSSW